MSTNPRLLDLFCCEGGASMGYAQAGFEVFGVDLFQDYSQKRYPFRSFKGDVFDFLARMNPEDFDVVVASPPCQRYSITNAARQADYPDLIGPTRTVLQALGKPYVIENVAGAPLQDPMVLCGSMFGLTATDEDQTPLRMERHRLFESNIDLSAPGPCEHDRSVQVAGSYGGARRDKWEAKHIRKGGYVPSAAVQQKLLGVDWMTQKGMYQCIPPAYTHWIGKQLLEVL